VIIFHSLTRDQIRSIVKIQAERLGAMMRDRGISLELTEGALDLLAREGYDPVYGARPLRRTIQKRIQDVLAMEILAGRFGQGDTVIVDASEEGLVFRKKE